jgi:putative glutamine amidotransferase
MSERPLIAIPTALEQAKYGAWDSPCALMPFAYIEAVQLAGGIGLLVPPDPAVVADPDRILDLVDGLLLSGGSDIDPAAYGEEPDPHTTGFVPARDQLELALVRAAIARDMPVLGICRGCQLLNVARGGTLIQHVPDVVHNDEHRRYVGTFVGNDHPVELEPATLAARAAGELHHNTKSHHHQAVDRIGDGLVVTGRSSIDGLAESIEMPEQTYVLGVQWHPEADPASHVVASLVEQARSYRSVRRAGDVELA